MTVTLDYKALIMLLKRKGSDLDQNEDGLCKRGLDTECCVFCKVIRVGFNCSCHILFTWKQMSYDVAPNMCKHVHVIFNDQ